MTGIHVGTVQGQRLPESARLSAQTTIRAAMARPAPDEYCVDWDFSCHCPNCACPHGLSANECPCELTEPSDDVPVEETDRADP